MQPEKLKPVRLKKMNIDYQTHKKSKISREKTC